MNDLYMATHTDIDYDQLNYMIVVANNKDHAIEMCSEVHSFTVEKIGCTEKEVGTIVLKGY